VIAPVIWRAELVVAGWFQTQRYTGIRPAFEVISFPMSLVWNNIKFRLGNVPSSSGGVSHFPKFTNMRWNKTLWNKRDTYKPKEFHGVFFPSDTEAIAAGEAYCVEYQRDIDNKSSAAADACGAVPEPAAPMVVEGELVEEPEANILGGKRKVGRPPGTTKDKWVVDMPFYNSLTLYKKRKASAAINLGPSGCFEYVVTAVERNRDEQKRWKIQCTSDLRAEIPKKLEVRRIARASRVAKKRQKKVSLSFLFIST
jgi:hypothetical protein